MDFVKHLGWIVLTLLLSSTALAETPGVKLVPDWERYSRVKKYDLEGTPCHAKAGGGPVVATVFYKDPVFLMGESGGFAQVRIGDGRACFLPAAAVRKMHKKPIVCLDPAPKTKVVSMAKMAPDAVAEAAKKNLKGIPAGKFFPTFYQIAQERFYPVAEGEETVRLIDPKGRHIKDVAPAFRKALLIQGTAALSDGQVLNIHSKRKGEWTFSVLKAGDQGHGISGFHLYPYRSIALDFDHLCDKIQLEGCITGNAREEGRDKKTTRHNRKKLAGQLLFIPRLKGAVFSSGDVHDGYVCAVDVGGSIGMDRLDIFVGQDPGGNPYYPPCRRDNALMKAGIQSIVPGDWRRFEDEGKGGRADKREYRVVAPHKALEVFAVKGVKCKRRIK